MTLIASGPLRLPCASFDVADADEAMRVAKDVAARSEYWRFELFRSNGHLELSFEATHEVTLSVLQPLET